jgi:DDE family transposase
MTSSVSSIDLWQKRVRDLLPGLTKPQAQVLGLLSYGMVMLDGCGITRLSNGLAKIEQVPANRLRQRLREFYYEAEAKRGKKRRAVDVQSCFSDLLRGILREWEGRPELALALDASTLGERFTVLSISVMYRGCGIPIAWKIIPAMQEGEWRSYWEEMLASLVGIVPQDWMVIVMADRGLYAAWLYRGIQRLGWHPMLRVKEDLSFRAQGEENFSPMGMRVGRRGRGWRGKGEWSEHGERMEGTVLIRWEKGYEEKLVVVTDLGEKEGNVAWYQMRFWIEDEYKDHKSGGWGWEQTKMEDPQRAERQWRASAVAMLMAVLVGGQEEAAEQEQKRRATRKLHGKRRVGRPPKPIQRPRGREQSCLMRGQQAIQAAVVRSEEIPMGHVVTEAWPVQTYAVRKPMRSWVKKRKEKEAKKRYQENKKARACRKEQTELEQAGQEPERKDRHAKPPETSCRGVDELKRNGQPNATSLNRSGRRASVSKKNIEHDDNGSEKSVSWKKNRNVNVASRLEQNVSKSFGGAESGMRRSSVSENSAWHAGKSEWHARRLRLRQSHRLCPRYCLPMRLSCRFPSHPS